MISSPFLIKNRVNPYSLIMFNFISKKILDYDIYSLGCPGELGYGIATAPDNVLPDGYIGLPGHDDITSDNYGNYKHVESESIMCWIPKFYYHCEGPIIHIADSLSFSNREIAKNNGYALHRAFIDGGIEQDGFFIDKYVNGVCEPSTSGIPKSAKNVAFFYNENGVNPSVSFTGNWFPYNKTYAILYQHAIKVRDTKCSSMSVFNWGAMLMLMLTHGWASKSTENNAWYMEDPLKNHVKGPTIERKDIGSKRSGNIENKPVHEISPSDIKDEKNIMSDATMDIQARSYDTVTDIHDPEIVFAEWYSTGYGDSVPTPFDDRLSHNGQNNGVLGLRTYGRTPFFGACQIDSVDLSYYIVNTGKIISFIKETDKMSELTCDADLSSTSSSRSHSIYPSGPNPDKSNFMDIDFKKYYEGDSLVGFYGNGVNNVFSNDTEGDHWILTGAGIPTPEGLSATSNETSQRYYADSSVNIDYKTNTILALSAVSSPDKPYTLYDSNFANSYFIFRGVRYPD